MSVQNPDESFDVQIKDWEEKIKSIQVVVTKKTNVCIFLGIPLAILLIIFLDLGISKLLSDAAICIGLCIYPAVIALPILLYNLWVKRAKIQAVQQLADEILQTSESKGMSRAEVVGALAARFPYSRVCDAIITKVDPETAKMLKQQKQTAGGHHSSTVQSHTEQNSPEGVKALLKEHIVRLNRMFQGKPGERENLRFIQQVLTDDMLTFAIDQIVQKIPEALTEKRALQSTETFGEWFMAVSICPWLNPEDVKANLGQEYMELLNELAGPALSTPGGKNIAHWVYCSNGNQAAAHLTLMPNPKGTYKGAVVLAQDLLTPRERQQAGLPPLANQGISSFVEPPRKPVLGVCYQCHISLQDMSSGVYAGDALLAAMQRIPYPCKSCGTHFCVNCIAEIKKEKNNICPYCGRNIGW